MSKKKKPDQGTRRLRKKLFYSFWIILLYRLGQFIPLPLTGGLRGKVVGVGGMQDFLTFLQSALGTNLQEGSLFTLGLMPTMTATIVVQLFQLSSPHRGGQSSSKEVDRRTRLLSLFLAVLYAIVKVRELHLVGTDDFSALEVEVITVVALTAGAMLVGWMGSQNSQKGLGGISLLVAVNIAGQVASQILSGEYFPAKMGSWEPLIGIGIYSVVVICLVVFMERSEIRIPVHRAMIDSPMQGISYMPIRLNPTGILPVMYVMAFFTLPLYVFSLLGWFYPNQEILLFWNTHLNLHDIWGIGVFFALFFVMTMGLSALYINPEDVADDLLRGGDYIEDVCPGEDTRRYMQTKVRHTSFWSAVIMGTAISAPLFYACFVGDFSSIYFLPMTLAILTGIILGVLNEARVLHTFDAYKPRI